MPVSFGPLVRMSYGSRACCIIAAVIGAPLLFWLFQPWPGSDVIPAPLVATVMLAWGFRTLRS